MIKTRHSKREERKAADAATRSSEFSTRASTAAQKDVKRSSSGCEEEDEMI